MRILTLFLTGLLTTTIFLDLGGCAGGARTNNAQSPLVAYQLEMRQAIDKEKRYPYGALDARKFGKVTIGFDDKGDGKADNFEIIKSSGDANLDHAALMAVYFAKLPPKPPELKAITHFIVEINFQ